MRRFLLALVLLLCGTSAFAQPERLPDNFPHAGEIKLHGRIVSISADHRTLLLRADSLLMPDGRTVSLKPLRDKQISLSSDTGCSSGSIQQLEAGLEISVIGFGSGSGKPMNARYISCRIAGGKTAPPMPSGQPTPAETKSVKAEALPPINAGLLAFCRQKIGQKVGDGQCTSLVRAGFRSIGATHPIAQFPGEGDYVWGRRVYYLSVTNGSVIEEGGALSGDAVLPGDVIQFRDALFQGSIPGVPGGSYSAFAPHHTAVVASVANGGHTLTLYEQNRNNQQVVVESTMRLSDLKQGWLRIYRPGER